MPKSPLNPDVDAIIAALKSNRAESYERVQERYESLDRELAALRRDRRSLIRERERQVRARALQDALYQGVPVGILRRELGLTKWADWKRAISVTEP